MMQTPESVRACYNFVAEEYAREFVDELGKKPLDQEMLQRFANAVRDSGPVWDLGCGPGQTTVYLKDLGVSICGMDLSDEMIKQASKLHPGIPFKQGNMFELNLKDNALAGIVAFYAIVHFSQEEMHQAFLEMQRVLRPGGLILLTFHLGKETIHVEEFLGKQVSMEFMFFQANEVVENLRRAGFEGIDITERDPYPEVEYQSRRAYVFARKQLDNAQN